MIKVVHISGGMFRVELTGDHNEIIEQVATQSPHDPAEILFSLLTMVLRLDTDNLLFKE